MPPKKKGEEKEENNKTKNKPRRRNRKKNDDKKGPKINNNINENFIDNEESEEEIEEFTGGKNPLRVGEIVKNKYEIISKIENGEISTTYFALDKINNKIVIIKVTGVIKGLEEKNIWKKIMNKNNNKNNVKNNEKNNEKNSIKNNNNNNNNNNNEKINNKNKNENKNDNNNEKNNFVQLIDFFTLEKKPNEKIFLLIFENYTKNLNNLLEIHNQKIPFSILKSITKQILKSLNIMHNNKNNIFHSNIQISNIYLDENLNNNNNTKIKIGTCWNKSKKYLQLNREFRSPEEIIGNDLGDFVDIWAVGCLVFQLATGDVLFDIEKNGYFSF